MCGGEGVKALLCAVPSRITQRSQKVIGKMFANQSFTEEKAVINGETVQICCSISLLRFIYEFENCHLKYSVSISSLLLMLAREHTLLRMSLNIWRQILFPGDLRYRSLEVLYNYMWNF